MQTHASAGSPAEALLEIAEAVGASTIVVGNRGMHGAKRVLGSIPNTVSHRARCNVLIVSTDSSEPRAAAARDTRAGPVVV